MITYCDWLDLSALKWKFSKLVKFCNIAWFYVIWFYKLKNWSIVLAQSIVEIYWIVVLDLMSSLFYFQQYNDTTYLLLLSFLLSIRTVRRASSAVHSYVLPKCHTYGTYNRKFRDKYVVYTLISLWKDSQTKPRSNHNLISSSMR